MRKFHHQFQTEARKPTIELVADGVASGDFPSRDPELAVVALLGAIFFCRLMTNTPFPEARIKDLIDTALGKDD